LNVFRLPNDHGALRLTATSAVILAGGKSRRFGEDKAFFRAAGTPMVLRVARVLGGIFDEVIVAGGNPEAFQKLGLRCYPDPIPERGALGGIYNGLSHSSTPQIFLCACDMPLLNEAVIKIIVGNTGRESITLPLINSIRQPLHAIYRRDILPLVEELLNAPNIYLPALLERASVNFLEEQLFAHIPDYELSFVNFNDPETAAKYLPLLEKDQK
jgi:molybdopterin-guanine dinucleotide biosynthesis protein A